MTFQCFCGDWRFKNAHFVIDEVRKEVCRDLPIFGAIDGREYCVLHFPEKGKQEAFNEVLRDRLTEDSWDFRMVYFPGELQLKGSELSADANFNHAIFSESVDFSSSKLCGRFDFFDSKFQKGANFFDCKFIGQVNFNGAEFSEYAQFAVADFALNSNASFTQTIFESVSFDAAKFHTDVSFQRSLFKVKLDFGDSRFYKKADFSKIKFEDGCAAIFERTVFSEGCSFDLVEFDRADFKEVEFGTISNAFQRAGFVRCRFKESAQFTESKFFAKADFQDAVFLKATYFERATFAKMANFHTAIFGDDVFFSDTFFGYKHQRGLKSSQVIFDGAEFAEDSRVFFENTWFSWHTSFDYVKFRGHVFFSGSATNQVFDDVFEKHAFWGLLSFRNTTFEKPEKVFFRNVRLRPSWFANSAFDLKKINFSDVYWTCKEFNEKAIHEELEVLSKRANFNTKRLLEISLRQLADNAEINGRFSEASGFRKMAFETERLIRKAGSEKWWREELICFDLIKNVPQKLKSVPYDLGSALYRLSSFYGESSIRAFFVLLVIITAFAIFYSLPVSLFADTTPRRLTIFEALFYSLRVMVLQRPEPFPMNSLAKGLVALESVLAPLQLALLALALRRKFMR